MFVFFGICVAIHPGLVLKRDEGGISNYGIHIKTALPYSLAFVVSAWYSLRAAMYLPSRNAKARSLRLVLQMFAIASMLILVSSYIYKINVSLTDLHTGINIAAAGFETFVAVWLYFSSRTRRSLVVWFVLELVGMALGVLIVANVLHVVFVAEVVAAIGFAGLLVESTRYVDSDS